MYFHIALINIIQITEFLAIITPAILLPTKDFSGFERNGAGLIFF